MDGETGFRMKNWLSELAVFHFQALFLMRIEE
jgi:hypothetical protein